MPKKKQTHAAVAEKIEPQFLNIAEVASLMAVSQRTIMRWTEAGTMPQPIRMGSIIRWRKTELDAWISSGCVVTA